MVYNATSLSNYQILQRDDNDQAVVRFASGSTKTLKTGGPYTVNNKSEIYVGDIWVMAGQSNMRGYGYLKQPYLLNAPALAQPNVHLFDSTETWRLCTDPTHELAKSGRTVHHTLSDPTVTNPKLLLYRGASLAPSFGANYEPGVPVGLIASAHGGVTLDQWKRPSAINKSTIDTTLYGAMIDRVRKVGGNIAGILWYQGESDAIDVKVASTYYKRFMTWVKNVRSDIEVNLPVVFVQLAYHVKPDLDKGWAMVQDQQRLSMNKDKYLVGVTAIDASLDDTVHISREGQDLVGRRLAKAAYTARNGKGLTATPLPVSASYQQKVYIKNSATIHSVLLKFNLPDEFKFDSNGQDIAGFAISGSTPTIGVLRATVEEWAQTIRVYLSGEPTASTNITYGLNQPFINLNFNQTVTLPAFNIPITITK